MAVIDPLLRWVMTSWLGWALVFIVLKSTPAAACFDSQPFVPNCDYCRVDGGSNGSEGCDMLYGNGNGYCDAYGSMCYSD